MLAYGWRVPFLLSALFAPLGVHLGRHARETKAFEAARGGGGASSPSKPAAGGGAGGAGAREPAAVIACEHPARLCLMVIGIGSAGANFYFLNTWVPTYLSTLSHALTVVKPAWVAAQQWLVNLEQARAAVCGARGGVRRARRGVARAAVCGARRCAARAAPRRAISFSRRAPHRQSLSTRALHATRAPPPGAGAIAGEYWFAVPAPSGTPPGSRTTPAGRWASCASCAAADRTASSCTSWRRWPSC